MDFVKIQTIIDALYKDVNGYDISAQERKKMTTSGKDLTYGEIVPEIFQEIIFLADPKPKGNFYDLGSGTGKAVFTASLVFDFSKAIGVEILSGLFNKSKEILKVFNQKYRSHIKSKNLLIDFINKDILKTDFTDADFIFIHSTCFNDEFMFMIEEKLNELKKGAKIITVTKTLRLPIFKLLKSNLFQMGWGKATVNIYRKE